MNKHRTKVHRRAVQSELASLSHPGPDHISRVIRSDYRRAEHLNATMLLPHQQQPGCQGGNPPLDLSGAPLSTDRHSDFPPTDAERPSGSRTCLFMLPGPSSAASPLLMIMKATEQPNAQRVKQPHTNSVGDVRRCAWTAVCCGAGVDRLQPPWSSCSGGQSRGARS